MQAGTQEGRNGSKQAGRLVGRYVDRLISIYEGRQAGKKEGM